MASCGVGKKNLRGTAGNSQAVFPALREATPHPKIWHWRFVRPVSCVGVPRNAPCKRAHSLAGERKRAHKPETFSFEPESFAPLGHTAVMSGLELSALPSMIGSGEDGVDRASLLLFLFL